LENLKGRYHLGDLEVDIRIILKWIIKNCDKISALDYSTSHFYEEIVQE
jgi:hypothetical protein